MPLTLVGVGIAWRMTQAVVSGFLETGGAFERTPKFRIEGARRSWRERAYARGLGSTRPEGLLGGVCAVGALGAVLAGEFRMAPSLAFFALASWTVLAYALWQR